MFQGNLGQLGGILEASWSVLDASWRCLGSILGSLKGILDASWTCLRENIEKRSNALIILEGFWKPKWRQQTLKFMFNKQLAFRGGFWHILCDFSCFWKSAGDDMFQENPCKTLAGRTKIEVRQGLAHKITFAKWKWKCYIFEAKKPSKWGQKSLKVRSGQVS